MDQSKEPHLITIKVLPSYRDTKLIYARLSRPSLADQSPLPEPFEGELSSLNQRASRGYPGAQDSAFSLSPLLGLPTGFGTAFVGSTFGCTVCASAELADETTQRISSVRIGAEISTPSHSSSSLSLYPEDIDGDASTIGLRPRETAQKLLKFDLREDGPHTLSVNVSYEITSIDGGGSVTGRRTRVFRKLYQFAAVPCLSVRTKASDMPLPPALLKERDAKQSLERFGERFALEAQLENLTDGPITLEKVTFNAKAPFISTSLNWDDGNGGTDERHLSAPTLSPRAVHQVCHIISEAGVESDVPLPPKEMTKDGRIILGTVSIKWRGPMGDPGVLSTGWLTSKRR